MGFLEEYPEFQNEWDTLNNILMPNPNNLTANSRVKVWWICTTNSEHRYKLSVFDKIKFKTRKREACSICKGLRRKREHFVSLKKFR
ncbi:zinc-ribbon domain-containing protein [Streptococcus pluranimalium]